MGNKRLPHKRPRPGILVATVAKGDVLQCKLTGPSVQVDSQVSLSKTEPSKFVSVVLMWRYGLEEIP